MEKIKIASIYPWHHPINIIPNIKEIVKSVRNFYERGRYGIASHWDCWDLDSYILKVFKNGLEKFRKDTWSYPANLTPEEWDNVLTHMEDLIQVIETEGLDCYKACKIYNKYRDLEDWNEHTNEWLAAVEEWEEYRQDALNELCDLFKEWFFHLWW